MKKKNPGATGFPAVAVGYGIPAVFPFGPRSDET